ncbi:IS30 family transposase [Halomonas sp. FME20]|uniref:IS30 family transposase n=1 Tax=Halomonas colorata TaxID=2742615 RepID=A0ABR9G233_9GAMM|nr:IS30 family transposase [Halomonas colorata]
MSYIELSIEERASIQVGQAQGMSLRYIARLLGRAPSTISREIRRNQRDQNSYCARHAQQQRERRRAPCRPKHKLLPGTERFDLIVHIYPNRLDLIAATYC